MSALWVFWGGYMVGVTVTFLAYWSSDSKRAKKNDIVFQEKLVLRNTTRMSLKEAQEQASRVRSNLDNHRDDLTAMITSIADLQGQLEVIDAAME